MRLKAFLTPFLALAAGSLFAASSVSAQDGRDFEGTWVAVHDVNGLVLPHFEVVRVRSDGETTVEIYASRLAETCDLPDRLAPPECRNPFVYARGKLAIDPSKSAISLSQTKPEPVRIAGWSGSDRNLAAALFWFGNDGAVWQYARQGKRLSMEREVSVPAQALGQPGNGVVNARIAKKLVRVDAQFAEDLITLLAALDVSALEGYCVAEAFEGPPAGLTTFRDFLSSASKGARTVLDLRKSVFEPDAEKAVIQSRVGASLWIEKAKPGDQLPADVAAVVGANGADLKNFLTARSSLADPAIAVTYMFPGLEQHETTMTACRNSIRR